MPVDMTAMRRPAAADATREPRASKLAAALTIGGLALLTAAGMVMWASQSEHLFVSYLVSALAGCF